MQVFIKRAQLAAKADAAIQVTASYDDHIVIAPTAHGPGMTVLSLGPTALRNIGSGITMLAPDWRDANRVEIAGGEARRRILEAFPEHAQRNAALELSLLTAQHGAAVWPKEAQKRRAEIERMTAYVTAVRRAAQGVVGALPADPTADAHWPPRAAVYQG
jgi:hypothetical protein